MHPLAWKEVGAEGEDDRNLATSPRETTRAQKKETLESKQRTCILLLRSNTSISKANRIKYDACHFNSMAGM